VDRHSTAQGGPRLIRGERIDALARELGVEVYRLKEWKYKAFSGIDASLREREGDPLEKELQSARSKIGELMLDIELLREKTPRPGSLAKRRSRIRGSMRARISTGWNTSNITTPTVCRSTGYFLCWR